MTEHAFRNLPARTPDIAASANAAVDRVVERGRMDLAADVATRVPVRTVAQLLGVPPDDEDLFMTLFNSLDTGRIETVGSGGEFYEYFVEQLEKARANPRGDLISYLAGLAPRTDSARASSSACACRSSRPASPPPVTSSPGSSC